MSENTVRFVQDAIPSWDRLRRVSPDLIADRLITFSKQVFPQLMLTEIAEALGMSIILDEIDGDGYLIEFGPTCAEILVKADAESRRRRFTIAHELGHWVVNRSIEKCGSRGSKTSDIESWCNRFAASLLLPTKWIYRFVGQYARLGDSGVVFSGSHVFRVSQTTFYRRLHDIYGVIFVEIDSNDNVKLWPRYYERSFRISEPYSENLRKSISNYWNRHDDSVGTIEGCVSAGPIALQLRRSDNQRVCRPAVLLLKRVNSGQKTSLTEFLGGDHTETGYPEENRDKPLGNSRAT